MPNVDVLWAIGIFLAVLVAFPFLFPRAANRPAIAFNKIVSQPYFSSLRTFAEMIGFAVVIGTAVQIMIELGDRRVDAIERNRNRLLSPAPGNTAKGEALSNLFASGTSLDGIDLSCHGIGKWDDAAQKCSRQVIFSNVNLTGKPPILAPWFIPKIDGIRQLDINDAMFRPATLEYFALFDVTAKRVTFADSKTLNSIIEGNLGRKLINWVSC